MARFTLPRDLYHGKGALEALKTFKGKKAMICVGGGSMKRFGFLQKAEEYLKEAGMEVQLFEGIEPDPSVETVMKGAAAMQAFEPDWIIAMGGGSPIDAAKAMWIKYEYPDITFEDMCKVFGIPALRNKAHFCAISSTSGTATEVTAFSIITDYEKGIKYPIADFEITPDVAIVDPDLAETMPQKLVAHGCDDTCDRGLCFDRELRLYRSACITCDQDDPERSGWFLQWGYGQERFDAQCAVSGRYGFFQCAARHRSFYGTQDRRSFCRLWCTYHPRSSQCDVSAKGYCFQCKG